MAMIIIITRIYRSSIIIDLQDKRAEMVGRKQNQRAQRDGG